jgi:hypothetical protein
MKSHVGLLFIHMSLREKVTWTIDVNKWHLVACELHCIYDIIYNIKVSGATFVTPITCLIALKLYKYLELQVFDTTQNCSCNLNCKTYSFFIVDPYMSKQRHPCTPSIILLTNSYFLELIMH